jgi:thiamine pyrophosphate-dependent acetolactate synthase large subunit-like protein
VLTLVDGACSSWWSIRPSSFCEEVWQEFLNSLSPLCQFGRCRRYRTSNIGEYREVFSAAIVTLIAAPGWTERKSKKAKKKRERERERERKKERARRKVVQQRSAIMTATTCATTTRVGRNTFSYIQMSYLTDSNFDPPSPSSTLLKKLM